MKRIVYTVLASLLLFMSVPEAAAASSADEVINIGKKYMGTKYRYGGTTTKGFDCSGYTQYVFREAGIPIARATGGQYSQGKAVSKSNLKTGDLVFFNTSGRGVSHVGIFIKGGKFIHASTSQGVMISPLNDPYYWGSRYIGARRVKDFNETVVAAPQAKPAPVVNYATRGEVAVELNKALKLSTDQSLNGSIAAVLAEGIFSGNANGEFFPSNNITRAELSKVLANAYDLSVVGQPLTFTDVRDGYHMKPYIDKLASNGVTKGKGDGTFGISDKVKFNDLLVFIDRASKK